MGKALVILAIGLFGIYMGIKSYNGYESEAEHLYQGNTVELTCDADGEPAGGPGRISASAQDACEEERKDQKDRTPYWVAGGAVFAYAGFSGVKKARAG
jgi:hypothetical protein